MSMRWTTASEPRPPKRLLFDRRYGWVIDEWKDPSKEALSGGRGMFCIVPLAKATLHVVSNVIDYTSSSIVEVIKKPHQLSPDSLKKAFDVQLQRVLKSNQKLKCHLLPDGVEDTETTVEESHDQRVHHLKFTRVYTRKNETNQVY